MLQPYNRCYPQFPIQTPSYVVMNQQQKTGMKKFKINNPGKETRKAIDHYSYALNEEIGRGFSSKVYRGRDENNQQPVAVKVIDMKMVKQSIHAVLLKNEINALKSFNSKNILKLFDVFQTQNNTYLITEYCDSGDLSNRIKKRGRIEEAEAVRILKDIVAGLYEISQKGFIHRDIKPANILMDGQVPKIADFGFAVQVNSNDARSQSKHFNVGTPLYMSPQALRQQGHTEKGDVWALGVMFYEMLYGRPPFTAQSEAALLSNILHQGLQIPANPPISELSKDLIRRCLQVDDNRRFRVKDIANHALVAQERTLKLPSAVEQVYERVPLRQISANQLNYQKDKRSHSQGVREYNSKPIRSDNLLQRKTEHTPKIQGNTIFTDQLRQNKRTPTDISNLQIDPKDIGTRSKSQKHMILDPKIFKEAPQLLNNPASPNSMKRQPSYDEDNSSRRAPILRKPPTFIEAETKVQPVSGPRFKGNNDILFSQINYCRFLYKFSQQLSAGAKTYPRLLSNNGLREKLLFIFSKNIMMKISKLQQLNDKENQNKENSFQLEEFETYRRSESFSKFSQAIWEYNEKYKKHFEKLYSIIQKNGLINDKKFEVLYDKEFNDFDSFYLISMSFVKLAIAELLQEAAKNNDKTDIEGFLPQESQYALWVVENLSEFLNLVQIILNTPGDYRQFLKNAKVELLVDKKPKKYSLRDLQEKIAIAK